MDRIISLLAALVGLIALGGAILVHTNADAQRNEMAAQIAQLKLSIDLIGHQAGMTPAAQTPPPAPAEPRISEHVAAEPSSSSALAAPPTPSSSSPPPSVLPLAPPSASSSEQPALSSAEGGTSVADVKALQDRIASLEQVMRDQASQLDAARSQISATPSTLPATTEPASTSASSAPAATPAAVVADGPSTDCIPLGTRFMASSGDNFAICKTRVVVKVAVVADGFATITGAGDVPAGTSADLAKGCNVMVFSADASGYAEMRVSCQ